MDEPDSQTLKQLHAVAQSLSGTAAECPRGARKTNLSLRRKRGDLTICELLETKKWLVGQINQYEIAIKAEKSKDNTSNLEGEDLTQRIEELRNELQKLTFEKNTKEQILQSLRLGETLTKKLFPATIDLAAGDLPYTEDKRTIKLVETQTILVSDILHFQKSIRLIRDRLDGYMKANLDLKKSNRQLMVDLNNAKEIRSPSENPEAAREIDYAIAKAEVIRHIFNGLIIGSGIHWAQDDHLRDLLISLGQPIETQLT